MYRCAILGCGNRARSHARAYGHVTRGRLVAACDRLDERRMAFGEQFGLDALYADLRTMLEAERPDVLHVVTLPHIRVEPLTIASECGVPAVIVEKPIALEGEDWQALRELAASSSTRFCVNTQLHFHAASLALKADVAAGRIGEVRGVDVSARSTPLDQGVHVLELAHSYLGFPTITQVFGQVGDAAELDSRQPAPGLAVARASFEGGVDASLICGACAPFATANVDNRYYHKRIAVWGTEGFVHWTMAHWEKRLGGSEIERGEHDYGVEDDLAQARLTEAAFDWIEDPARPHPCRIERSLAQFEAVLALYVSALEHRPVPLPLEAPAGVLGRLRERLAG